MVTKWLRSCKTLFANMTTVGNMLVEIAIVVSVSMKLQVLLQLETFVKSLAANFTHGADFPGVFPHMIEQIFFLSKHITASVTLVLNTTSVDGHMFFQTV